MPSWPPGRSEPSKDVDGARCDVQTVGISVQDFFDQRDQRVTAKMGTLPAAGDRAPHRPRGQRSQLRSARWPATRWRCAVTNSACGTPSRSGVWPGVWRSRTPRGEPTSCRRLRVSAWGPSWPWRTEPPRRHRPGGAPWPWRRALPPRADRTGRGLGVEHRHHHLRHRAKLAQAPQMKSARPSHPSGAGPGARTARGRGSPGGP